MASASGAPSMASGWRQSASAWPRALLHLVERWLDSERDQLGLWLPVGLGLGIGAWFGLPNAAAWRAFLALAAGGGLLATVAGGGTRAGRAAAVFLLAACAGCLLAWGRSERVAAPRLARTAIAQVSARIVEVDPLPARNKLRLLLAPEPASDAKASLPPRLRVNLDAADAPEGLLPGARVALRARLLPPPGPSLPGGYDYARVAWFQGIGATGKALGPVKIVASAPPGGGFARWLALRRLQLTRHIEAALAGSTGGVAAAFVTGNVGAISPDDAEAFRRSGLAHLLSISGLHITVAVAAAMLLTLRLLALWPWLALRAPLVLIAAGAGAAAGIAYTLLSGAEVPTVRSCVAALLVLAGVALGREAMTLRLVAAGAIAVLLFRPEALVGPSFQLSFAAVTAIVALHEHPRMRAWTLRTASHRWPRRLAREGVSLVATGLLVEAALAPIAAYHFHRAGFYGALANLFAIPLSTFAIMPLEALALLGDTVGLGAPAWWLAGEAVGLLLWLARTVAALPGAVAALPSMPLPAFLLMVAGGLWIALWRMAPRWLGLLPFAIGMAWALATPAPDLLVTGDGRHLAIRDDGGALRLLRPRAGDYTRQRLNEGAGLKADALDLDDMAGARCSDDLCLVAVTRGGHRWHLLATRSPYVIDRPAFAAACAWADIAVSDRRLPGWCRPRRLKLDAPALARSGGIAMHLASGAITGVISGDRHPWMVTPPPLRAHAWKLHGMQSGFAALPSGAPASSHGQ